MKPSKIVVLGSRGMLGQMVVRYFKDKFPVIAFDEKYTYQTRQAFLEKLASFEDAWVVNCIGKIKQKSDSPEDLFLVNTLLPLDLCASLHPSQVLIHPSTDCVYSGSVQDKWYAHGASPDAADEYGRSKLLAEIALAGKPNVYIIRVSIIGPDDCHATPRGLLGWFLSNQPGSQLNGFTNHFWNGITTLQWCRFVEQEILSGANSQHTGKVLQLGTSQVYSKYQMLELFQQAYHTAYTISTFQDKQAINRCMEPAFICPPLENQLQDLASFWNQNK